MPLPDRREAVFARIREALRQPAPHRHDGHVDYDMANHSATREPPPAADAFRAWLPSVGPGIDDQIALFAQNSIGLKTDFRAVASMEEAAAQLAVLAMENQWKRVASHHHPLASPLAEKLGLPCVLTDAGYATADLESCDAAITGCDALVSQTGSVLVTTQSAGGRALSVLPPHHIVIAQRSQIVPDLAAALQLARKRYALNWPSFLSFITGPSRTGDIERILVLGAHGPKKLTVFLLPTT
jgi:L-lactate dehydrogenase complex protein LldG